MCLDDVNVSGVPTKKAEEGAYEEKRVALVVQRARSTFGFHHVIETMSAARYPRVAPGSALLSGARLKRPRPLYERS